LPDFVEEAVGSKLETKKPGLLDYVSLLSAVLAVSANGSCLALLHGVHPLMKLFWRMTATYLCLSVFAIKTIVTKGFPKLASYDWLTLGGAVACFSVQMGLYYTALSYTSIGNAVIGANSQAILLILGKLLAGESVSPMEGSGVLVAFAGAILCARDEASESKTNTSNKMAMFGDCLALLSGAVGVFYLTFAKALRESMSVTVFMFLVMLLGSGLVFIGIVASGAPFQLSTNPYSGLIGWVSFRENRLYVLLVIALVCNIMGTMGFVRVM
jgi:drug/metabolite transporter (DMT)-like permease